MEGRLQHMLWADIAILTIIALSVIVSFIRGFVREALSLAVWIAAFWVAFTFAGNLAMPLQPYIKTPSLQLITAFGALFLVTLVLGSVISFLVVQLVMKSGLSGTDRMLGVVFGVLRGGIIVAILVLLAGLTPLPGDPWWKQSIFLGHFQELAIWLRGFLPPDIANNFVYD